jgi:hypothetical protein
LGIIGEEKAAVYSDFIAVESHNRKPEKETSPKDIPDFAFMDRLSAWMDLTRMPGGKRVSHQCWRRCSQQLSENL